MSIQLSKIKLFLHHFLIYAFYHQNNNYRKNKTLNLTFLKEKPASALLFILSFLAESFLVLSPKYLRGNFPLFKKNFLEWNVNTKEAEKKI